MEGDKLTSWLKHVVDGKFYIRNGLVYVQGSVNIKDLPGQCLPCQFEHITDTMWVEQWGLQSLKGCPKIVGGSFNADDNNLKSLIGGPRFVGGDYWCERCGLLSLEGSPLTVGGSFFCEYNKLTSLEGAPKVVGRYLFCRDNNFIKPPDISKISANMIKWKD